MNRQRSDPLQSHCLSLESIALDPLHIPHVCKAFSGNDTTAHEIEEKHSPSPRLKRGDLTAQDVHAICADIIEALVEHASELSDVSAGEEETEVCSICLESAIKKETSAVSSNDDIKTPTDIKTLLCGDNPSLYTTMSTKCENTNSLKDLYHSSGQYSMQHLQCWQRSTSTLSKYLQP
jgi:hypothetical protein